MSFSLKLLPPPPGLLLPLPGIPHIRRRLDAQGLPQIDHVRLHLLLPVHVDDILGSQAVLDRPGQVRVDEAPPLSPAQREGGKGGQARHGQEGVGELEGLEGDLALAHDGEARQRVVKVMALSVALQDVRALLVVHVPHVRPRVRGDPLAVQPGHVRRPDGPSRQRAKPRQVERRRGDTRPVAEDPAAGGRGEHGVAEARDEVGGRGRFGKGGDQVYGGVLSLSDLQGGKRVRCCFSGLEKSWMQRGLSRNN